MFNVGDKVKVVGDIGLQKMFYQVGCVGTVVFVEPLCIVSFESGEFGERPETPDATGLFPYCPKNGYAVPYHNLEVINNG